MKRTIFLLGLILLLSTISIGIAEDFKVEVSANASSFELGESITWTLTPTGGTPDYTIRVYGVMLDLGESSSTMIYTNANPDTYQYNVVSTSGEPVIFKYTPTQINGIMYISWDAWDSNNMYDGGYSEKVTVTGNILPVTATFVPDKTNPQIGEDLTGQYT